MTTTPREITVENIDEMIAEESDGMGFVRYEDDPQPCSGECSNTTLRVEGYVNDGNVECGPYTVERRLCRSCAVQEAREAELYQQYRHGEAVMDES